LKSVIANDLFHDFRVINLKETNVVKDTIDSQGDFMRRRTFIASVGALSLTAAASEVPGLQAGASPGPGSSPAKREEKMTL